MLRLNKYLSEAGVCSRREADRLIEQGRVKVDGTPATVCMQVDEHAQITVEDVYKRQAYSSHSDLQSTPADSAHNRRSCLKSVSYTHLDVYKRQMISSMSLTAYSMSSSMKQEEAGS